MFCKGLIAVWFGALERLQPVVPVSMTAQVLLSPEAFFTVWCRADKRSVGGRKMGTSMSLEMAFSQIGFLASIAYKGTLGVGE